MFRPMGPRGTRFRRLRLRRQGMNSLIPNALTVLALCSGLMTIRFGLLARWDLAVVALVLAAVFDTLDGRIARLLGGTSKFGAELDSLSDFVSFGVAPAVVVYLWSLQQFGGIGWAIVLLFAVCCALRLARFNTMLGDPNPPPWAGHYFTGVPAPAGAGLAILPMIITLEFGNGLFDRPLINAIALIVVALLMVSRIPTFSAKRIHIPPSLWLPTLLFVCLFAAALASAPWATLISCGVVYLGSIPVAIWTQSRARRRTGLEVPLPTPSLPPHAEGVAVNSKTESGPG